MCTYNTEHLGSSIAPTLYSALIWTHSYPMHRRLGLCLRNYTVWNPPFHRVLSSAWQIVTDLGFVFTTVLFRNSELNNTKCQIFLMLLWLLDPVRCMQTWAALNVVRCAHVSRLDTNLSFPPPTPSGQTSPLTKTVVHCKVWFISSALLFFFCFQFWSTCTQLK